MTVPGRDTAGMVREPLGEARARLHAAVLSDACDRAGLRACSIDRDFPLALGPLPILGWARPVAVVPVEAPSPEPYAEEVAVLDALRPDDVLVIASHEAQAAVFGELLSHAARARGAAGAIVDGPVRDVARIEPSGFSLLATRARTTDCLARISYRRLDVPVAIGGVEVRAGDLVAGDRDGVVVVPAGRAAEVLAGALEKVAVESEATALLREGALLSEAWDRFGVL